MRVLIADKFEQSGLDGLASLGCEVHSEPALKDEALAARVGQLQQLQPFFGLALAGLLLHEPVAWSMIAATALVVACVFFARRFA